MICDKKFIAKNWQKQFKTNIDRQEIKIKAGEKQIFELKDKLEDITDRTKGKQ